MYRARHAEPDRPDRRTHDRTEPSRPRPPAVGYAGDTFNVAAYLARTAAPGTADVQFVTLIGDDPYSTRMRESWTAHGVASDHTRIVPGGQPSSAPTCPPA
ncbi:PfkB family carbohydrate kinase [Actinomadura mexicana]|uniref:PfkB family carbohydrate kinase n=1 Tax=Actinomadura mexicana TaxID=134959 RepID=UPI000B771DFF|nr:PfkB family carbohydrate kinase [Actinomadura mexicana]